MSAAGPKTNFKNVEDEMFNQGYRVYVGTWFESGVPYNEIKSQIESLCIDNYLRNDAVYFDDVNRKIYFKYGFEEIKSILYENNISDICSKNPGRLNDSLIFGWSLYNIQQELKENELIFSSTQFLKNIQKDVIKLSDIANINIFSNLKDKISERSTQESILEELYKNNNSILIGDMFHENQASKQFLINHSEKLKSLNVNYIFLEHFTDQLQPSLDHFFKTGEMGKDLACYVNSLDERYKLPHNGYNFYNLLIQMQKNKIKPIALETTYSYEIKSNTSGINSNRLRALNYLYKEKYDEVIKNDPNAKSIGFVGGAHVSTHQEIPGISDIMRCPVITLNSSGSQSMLLDHFDLKHRFYTHIYLKLDVEKNRYVEPVLRNEPIKQFAQSKNDIIDMFGDMGFFESVLHAVYNQSPNKRKRDDIEEDAISENNRKNFKIE